MNTDSLKPGSAAGGQTGQSKKNTENRPKPYYLSLDPIIPWTQSVRPINWTGMFGREAPLEVEIGFGNGELLARRAAESPEINFVGIELTWASTKRALRRLAKAGTPNVRLLQLDARVALDHLFTCKSIRRLLSLFPVPWPKERHAGRRLFSHDFMQLVNNRLTDDGSFLIVTDYFPLLEWILPETAGTGLKAGWQSAPARFATKYERKWQENGQESFYELLLTKETHLDLPNTEDCPLINYRLKSFDPDNFHPQGQTGPVTVKFKEYLYDPRKRQAMLLSFVVEDNLRQDVWIKIKDEGDYWHLGLAQNGHVMPTEAVKLALDLARQAARPGR